MRALRALGAQRWATRKLDAVEACVAKAAGPAERARRGSTGHSALCGASDQHFVFVVLMIVSIINGHAAG